MCRLSNSADVVHDAQVGGDGLEPPLAAIPRKRVLVHVARSVVRLARVAAQARDGQAGDEHIEGPLAIKITVQVQAGRLRRRLALLSLPVAHDQQGGIEGVARLVVDALIKTHPTGPGHVHLLQAQMEEVFACFASN